ncbi:MAG: polysaccharide deacetylase family protein [Chitinophagaceae bacterium]
MVFTGDEFADGGVHIAQTLKREKIKASFFLTGRFYRTEEFKTILKQLKKDGHYLGAHSNEHLLYCDWEKRDSLLVTEQQFKTDLEDNYAEMKKLGVEKGQAVYFLPPYEWYNDTISVWTKELGLQLINFTPGTRSTADYTTPGMKNFRSSDEIYRSIINYGQSKASGLNGFILVVHIGTDPKRTDKFYYTLPELIRYLKIQGYQFQTVNQLLKPD